MSFASCEHGTALGKMYLPSRLNNWNEEQAGEDALVLTYTGSRGGGG
jgi:hypothetical protein